MDRDQYVIQHLMGQPQFWIKFRSVEKAIDCINASTFCQIRGGYPKAPAGILFHIVHHPESDKATLMIGGRRITAAQMREIATLATERFGGTVEKAHFRKGPQWAEAKDFVMAWFEKQPKGTPLECGLVKPRRGKSLLVAAFVLGIAILVVWLTMR